MKRKAKTLGSFPQLNVHLLERQTQAKRNKQPLEKEPAVGKQATLLQQDLGKRRNGCAVLERERECKLSHGRNYVRLLREACISRGLCVNFLSVCFPAKHGHREWQDQLHLPGRSADMPGLPLWISSPGAGPEHGGASSALCCPHHPDFCHHREAWVSSGANTTQGLDLQTTEQKDAVFKTSVNAGERRLRHSN